MASINTAINMNRARVNTEGVNEQELPDELNAFFTMFERHALSADLLELRKSLCCLKAPKH